MGDSDFAAEDFIAGPGNATARTWLARVGSWPRGRLALYGTAGIGKSHLLHVWAERVGARVVLGPTLREGERPGGEPVAIDDADLVANERTLLHLINFSAETNTAVLLAGRTSPHEWPVRLPDLASRLRATQAVRIEPPDDAHLALIFARFLSQRQLMVRPELQTWLLVHLPRLPTALAEAAARLDRAALAEGRRVDRGMAARVLAELGADAEGDDPGPSRASPDGARLL